MPRSRDGRWAAECKGCGVPFEPTRAKQKYHSRECAEEHRSEWANPAGGTHARADLELRVCLNRWSCPRRGKPFQPTRASQLTCSRQCRDSLPENRDKQHVRDSHPERRTRQNELRRLETAEDAEHRRFINLRANMRRLGLELTLEQYQEWLARQDGTCKLCGDPVEGKKGHTDHDHVTGQLRDLLCGTCNQGLGCFRDDPALLRAAAEYIERHRALAVMA